MNLKVQQMNPRILVIIGGCDAIFWQQNTMLFYRLKRETQPSSLTFQLIRQYTNTFAKVLLRIRISKQTDRIQFEQTNKYPSRYKIVIFKPSSVNTTR